MRTKFAPHPLISRILRRESAELRKHHVYSTWFYDKEEHTITICSTHPGFWIGLRGIKTQRIQDEINEVLRKHNEPEMTIKYIECES